jgi:DNA-binding winged helix-turn-helix (wHTH) protein
MNLRFDTFKVDLEGLKLLKRGMPITLGELWFQVLAALMERPGEIVTREGTAPVSEGVSGEGLL